MRLWFFGVPIQTVDRYPRSSEMSEQQISEFYGLSKSKRASQRENLELAVADVVADDAVAGVAGGEEEPRPRLPHPLHQLPPPEASRVLEQQRQEAEVQAVGMGKAGVYEISLMIIEKR